MSQKQIEIFITFYINQHIFFYFFRQSSFLFLQFELFYQTKLSHQTESFHQVELFHQFSYQYENSLHHKVQFKKYFQSNSVQNIYSTFQVLIIVNFFRDICFIAIKIRFRIKISINFEFFINFTNQNMISYINYHNQIIKHFIQLFMFFTFFLFFKLFIFLNFIIQVEKIKTKNQINMLKILFHFNLYHSIKELLLGQSRSSFLKAITKKKTE